MMRDDHAWRTVVNEAEPWRTVLQGASRVAKSHDLRTGRGFSYNVRDAIMLARIKGKRAAPLRGP